MDEEIVFHDFREGIFLVIFFCSWLRVCDLLEPR
jgi:hypothetical protein